MKRTVKLHSGPDARGIIYDPTFQKGWRKLAEQDPRITIFQEPEFCLAWFEATSGLEEPIVLAEWVPNANELSGILVLSRNIQNEEIRHAGAHQAVYDGWIAAPDNHDQFITQCIEMVFQAFPTQQWNWRYLPPDSAFDWAQRENPAQAPWISQVSTYALPRWNLSDEDFFKRKANSKRLRNYANRYRKQGNLRLETITDSDEAKRLLSYLVDWVDFRQGAVHQTLPFRADTSKFSFYLGLVLADQGTRMSALMLDDRPLAIQIDSVDEKNKALSLCLHGYDPAEGQKSPGMILLALLAQAVREEGFSYIDLTPGEKTWKDDFANEWLEGQRVELFGRYRAAAKESGKRQFARFARSMLKQAGIKPSEAKSQARKLKETLRYGPKTIHQKVTGNHGPRVYRLEISSSVSSIGPAIQTTSIDPIQGLLKLDGHVSAAQHSLLLFDALKRFERGALAFAHVTEGGEPDPALTQLSWLHLPPSKFVPPPPSEAPALASPINNLCEHFDFDPNTDALLVITYENDLDEDPVSVLTPAMNKVRDEGLSHLYIASCGQHAASIRWLAARGEFIALSNLASEPKGA